MSKEQELQYLEMGDDELDLILGDALLKESFGNASMSDDEKRQAAKNWFKSNISIFAKSICEDNSIGNILIGKDKKERNILICSVLDVVLKSLGVSVPVAALAAKILHYGVENLCTNQKPL